MLYRVLSKRGIREYLETTHRLSILTAYGNPAVPTSIFSEGQQIDGIVTKMNSIPAYESFYQSRSKVPQGQRMRLLSSARWCFLDPKLEASIKFFPTLDALQCRWPASPRCPWRTSSRTVAIGQESQGSGTRITTKILVYEEEYSSPGFNRVDPEF